MNKNKASHHKQRQFNCCFLSLFYFLSIISAFVANMSFIEALFRLRICLFRYVVCRRESSKTCYFSTVLTLLLLTMVSVSSFQPIRARVIWKLYYKFCLHYSLRRWYWLFHISKFMFYRFSFFFFCSSFP